MFVKIIAVCIVFSGIFSATESLAADVDEQSKVFSHSYQKLLTLFPEDCQGYGLDRFKLAEEDQPMSYGLILSAEAIRAKYPKESKNSPTYQESRRRVKKAVTWLLENADLDKDGKPGWGLPQSWDAWGDGTENPRHQPYTITSAIVLNGLLDALEVPDLFDENQRKEIKQVIRNVAMRWCREIWSDGYGGGYFWYSPSKVDDIFGINASAMFLGSLVRLLNEQVDSLSRQDRELVTSRVHSLAKAIVSTVKFHYGQPFWRYAPLPNRYENNRPNDLVHHVYILFGIEQYRDWDRSRVKIPWTREKAIESVDQFMLVTEDEKSRRGNILEYTHVDDPQGPQARLWGAGFMLAFYAKWADSARTLRVFKIIEKNYGPMPRQHWVADDSCYKDTDACYHRHNAHVLYGLAIAAFR
ncbi:MAG: hypothetical protein JXM70_22230 [Pirellulales bacterium]|nr:hypothetical protein [Pirellulales bacterium]